MLREVAEDVAGFLEPVTHKLHLLVGEAAELATEARSVTVAEASA